MSGRVVGITTILLSGHVVGITTVLRELPCGGHYDNRLSSRDISYTSDRLCPLESSGQH